MAGVKHVWEIQKAEVKTVGVVPIRMGEREEALPQWLAYAKKKDQQKLSVSHPEKSSTSINDKTPKREHTHELACKLTSPFRFKSQTKR